MQVGELIKRLEQYDPDLEIMVMDLENNNGVPRELNAGPCLTVISDSDADETADCEHLVGATIVRIGFGCY